MLFETNRRTETLEYLKKFLDNSKVGMTKEKYLSMCIQMGDEPDWDKCPPEYSDFPSYIHAAIDIFNSLPDTYSGGMEPLYIGKNIGPFSELCSLFDIDKEDRLMVFEVIQFLDKHAREQAIRAAKKKSK